MYWVEQGVELYRIKYNIYDTTYKNRRKEIVCDDIMCFDIETSSAFYDFSEKKLYYFSKNRDSEFYKKLEKVALCYMWQFSINENVYMGRTLEDFKDFLENLSLFCPYRKYVYVHNLPFEFQFLRNILEFDKVFARTIRKPLFFNYESYQFRCSYMLTRMSLENWAIQKRLPIRKLVGYLDYNIPRTPLTELSKKQIQYGVNDVQVMYFGLLQYKEKYGHVIDIPLTQTGEVRKEIRKIMEKETDFRKNCINLIPKKIENYAEMVEVYWGGYVHANYIFANRVIENMKSKDFSSSYPAVACLEKYPMSPFFRVPYNDKYLTDDRYSFIIKIKITNCESRFFNSYLSSSKVRNLEGCKFDNGRIMKAKSFECSLTNIDYNIFIKSYECEKIEILDFKISRNGYLNKEFVLYILSLYGNKTKLKNIEEYRVSYEKSKEFINALYGVMVTKDITDEITFNNDWGIDYLDEKMFNIKVDKLSRNQKKVFTAYQFGVWITAYARRNLWDCVFEFDNDIVYMDTDSVKYINNHDDYFMKYNENIRKKQELCAKRLNVNISMFRPIDTNGETHSIGEFEDDGDYDKFKTLGAKKYIIEKKGNLQMTVSGVRKSAVKQLQSIDDFSIKTTFTIDNANKLLLHYNDNQPTILWNEGYKDEFLSTYKYGICGQPTTYTLGMSFDYYSLILKEASKKTKIFEEINNDKTNVL